MTPFQEKVIEILRTLGERWVDVDHAGMTTTESDALSYLVYTGHLDSRLRLHIEVADHSDAFDTIWDVSGDYEHDLLFGIATLILDQVGRVRELPDVYVVAYVAARVNGIGEEARQEVEERLVVDSVLLPERDLTLLESLTGGPDGKKAQGGYGFANLREFHRVPRRDTSGVLDSRSVHQSQPTAAAVPGFFVPLGESSTSIEQIMKSAQATLAAPSGGTPPSQSSLPPTSTTGLVDDLERMLKPNEQATRLLGPPVDGGRDRNRRLQITGELRQRSLAAGYLKPDDVHDTGIKSKGTFVRAAAWELPVAYFKAIRVSARTDDAAKKVFPDRDAGSGKEWYYCERCVKSFTAAPPTRRCPTCASDVEPLVLRRP